MKTFTLIAAMLVAPAVYAGPGMDSPSKPADTTKTTDTTKPAKATKLSTAELNVAAHYHELNVMEIDLGKAAIKTAKSDAVKEYGRMLVKEHGESNKKILAMAKARGQKIPAEKLATEVEKQEKADAKAAAAKLKKLKGSEFDTAFLAQMVADHERELAKVDAMVAQVEDTELAEMVRATKPVLQHHADQARELQKNNAQASIGTGAAIDTTAKR